MSRYHTRLFFGVLLFFFVSSVSATQAAEDIFNPHFILSDEELQDWRAMSKSEIQQFLDEQGGKIADMRHKDENGVARSTADIIYDVSKEHQINPKYTLVKLQKEQSLVTAKSPTEKQVNWATGYGVCDACKTTDPNIQKFKGFYTQVNKGAGIMRWYYDNMDEEVWIRRKGKSYTIDNQTVKPQSNATGFLYTYTPHIHGNKNFWILWQRWFEQVYPDGTLVKAEGNPRVYLIHDGEKRVFENFSALSTRFDPSLIVTVPASELGRYKEGSPITLPNYSILKQASNYFLLDFDELRPFEDADAVRKLGYHPDEIVEVSSADLNAYRIGRPIQVGTIHPTGELIRLKEDGVLYFVKDGVRRPLFDNGIADINFPNFSPRTATLAELGETEEGEHIPFKNGTLIKPAGSPYVYVMEHGKRRHITSEEVFTGLGFRWKNIIETNRLVMLHTPEGEPLYLRRALPSEEVIEEEIDETDYRDLMQRTPLADTEFIGPEFSTDVDAYAVIDADSGEILAGKNVDVVRPLASLTKVMSGYRVMRDGISLSKVQTYDPKDHNGVYHRFRVASGERFFNRDLMDASLVSSLNTPTRMLVDAIEPNESAFVSRMNEQANEWGLKKTRFVDVTGESEQNVSTVREYAELFQKATKNRTVHSYLAKSKYEYTEFEDVDGKPDHFDSHSNKLRNASGLPFRVGASKTGYLYESGANLIMEITEKTSGKAFLIVTMGDVDHPNRFAEPKRLAEWALEQF